MPRTLGFALGAAVALAAGVASAQDVQGTMSDVDPIAKSITVDGQSDRMPVATTAGVSLDQLNVGEKVEIIFKPDAGKMPIAGR
jgi:hypothetical protein